MERTLAIIKPNIIQKNLVGEIINIWEKKGLRIIGLKMVHLTQQEAEIFYEEHKEKSFFWGTGKFYVFCSRSDYLFGRSECHKF